MDWMVLAVFGAVYFGMILGRIPGLALDRTGVALLGAIFFLWSGRISTSGAWEAVDTPTIALLAGLMIVSAQFRLSGFYSFAVRRIAGARVGPGALLALLIALAGSLSAVLANDIVCLAMAPVVVEGCAGRDLEPRPFLLGLACAANIGSAATLIGNPQNMLIGQVLRLSFARYLAVAAVPSVAGLFLLWLVLFLMFRKAWRGQGRALAVEAPAFDSWQTSKGFAVLAALVAAFLFAPIPREIAALAGAGVLLCSRRMRSAKILGLVDWQLIVLFISLFIVNRVMAASGNLGLIQGGLASWGVELSRPAWLFGLTVALSNIVSNVPAVMLLLPSAHGEWAGPLLALASTLAGNLFIVGSIANIIVVDQAARMGVFISWRRHAMVGVPVTLLTLAVAALWLFVVYG